MKKTIRTMLIAVMAAMMMLAMGLTASAATQKVSVTYKKKTVTILSSSQTYKDQKKLMYTALKKLWGKCNTHKTTKKNGRTISNYTWKKGSSFITLKDNGRCINYVVSIKDKNMKLDGFYIGMSRAAAKKMLKKILKENYYDYDSTNSSSSIVMSIYGGLLNLSFKSGKVSRILYMAY